MLKALPNALSLLRLFLVPVVIWLLLEELYGAAFWTFLTAGVLDAVDGYLARRLDARTTLGGYLDPIADKALIVGVYVSLGMTGELPSWLVLLVVFRDIFIMGGVVVLFLIDMSVRVKPLIVSKVNTFMQVALAATVLAASAFGFMDVVVVDILIWLTSLTTVASGGAYVYVWGRRAMGAIMDE